MSNLKVLAGIVLYNPDLERLSENVSAIIPQVDILLLVDNKSNNINEIISLYKETNKVLIISNSDNKGIAYALNQILNYAYEHNYKWYLTLDQDSVAPSNLIESYLMHIEDSCALITCRVIDRNFESTSQFSNTEYVNTCITSACFNNTDICRLLGGYDDVLFIDSVDHDLCFRVRKFGFKILRVNTVALFHELGHSKKVCLLGKHFVVYNHTPIRSYYIFRNRIYLGRKYHFLLNSIKYILIRLLLIIGYEKDKSEKIRLAIKGVFDGFNMKLDKKNILPHE